MDEKQKQIEVLPNHSEISDIANSLYNMQDRFDLTNPYEVGYAIINMLGYRKIPENAVVLTKEEKSKLLHEMYEQGKFDGVVKFAEKLKEKGTIHTEFDWNDYLQIDIDDIDEICKEITES